MFMSSRQYISQYNNCIIRTTEPYIELFKAVNCVRYNGKGGVRFNGKGGVRYNGKGGVRYNGKGGVQ